MAAVLVVLLAAGAVTGYQYLNSRIGNLERQLIASGAAQEEALDEARDATDRQLHELRHQVDQQGDEVAATKNKLAAQPAAAKVAKQAAPSVFTVYAGNSLGSAFVVRSSGGHADLLTNYHVVSDEYAAGNRSVEVRRDSTSHAGQIIDVSEANDLAVIRVDAFLPTLELLTRRADVGDPVLVLGSPNGLAGTVTSGIVSSYRDIEATDYLQFSAPISPGNSGGPVLDGRGKVLGVAVMKDVRDDTEGISYAIPTHRICEALDVC
jgi:putative serine protease PepD